MATLKKQEARMSSTNCTLAIHDNHEAAPRHMRMKWVMVTDGFGTRRPQMRWWTVT
jgi:hypothetical protein